MENMLNIKTKKLILFLLIINISCNKLDKNESIQTTVYEYIDEIENHLNRKPKTSKKYIVRVKQDSSITNYRAYRINVSPNLIFEDEKPKSYDKYKNVYIVYLYNNEKILNPNNIDINSLKMNERTRYYNTRYPEWVLIENILTKKSTVVKNMSFDDLNSILEKNRTKID